MPARQGRHDTVFPVFAFCFILYTVFVFFLDRSQWFCRRHRFSHFLRLYFFGFCMHTKLQVAELIHFSHLLTVV